MACKQGFQLFLFSSLFRFLLFIPGPCIHPFLFPFYSLLYPPFLFPFVHFVFFTPLFTLFSSNPCLKKKRIPGGHIFKTTTQPNSLCYITKLTKVTYTLPFIFRLLGLVGH